MAAEQVQLTGKTAKRRNFLPIRVHFETYEWGLFGCRSLALHVTYLYYMYIPNKSLYLGWALYSECEQLRLFLLINSIHWGEPERAPHLMMSTAAWESPTLDDVNCGFVCIYVCRCTYGKHLPGDKLKGMTGTLERRDWPPKETLRGMGFTKVKARQL